MQDIRNTNNNLTFVTLKEDALRDIEEGFNITYGSWRECDEKDATHFLVPYASGSDYSGNTVELSNFQALMEDFKDLIESGNLIEVSGGYKTFGLVSTVETSEEFVEAMRRLENYPLYDEDHNSELERELQEAAVPGYVLYDLNRELLKYVAEEDEDDFIEVDEDMFWFVYTEYELYNKCEWIHEDNGWPYIDTRRLAEEWPEQEEVKKLIEFRNPDQLVMELN